jgi:hypothetical protein
MSHRHLDEEIELDLDGIREADVHIISGAVAASAGPAPGHARVRYRTGVPMVVEFEDGVLEIRREEGVSRLFDGFHEDVVVELTCPPDVLLRLGVVSASVVARGFESRVDAGSVSGPVTLDALAGPVRVKTVSGDVEARSLQGSLSANTVSGEVTLVDGRCDEVDVRTVSGDVVLDLHVDPEGSYAANTLSGGVALRLDDDVAADLDVTTATGRIDSAFDIGGERGLVGERLTGRLGDGGPRIKVRTMSGKVSLLRPART